MGKPKFKIGDSLFYCFFDVVKSGIVDKVNIRDNNNKISIVYRLKKTGKQ